jgi:hypothetical protein
MEGSAITDIEGNAVSEGLEIEQPMMNTDNPNTSKLNRKIL